MELLPGKIYKIIYKNIIKSLSYANILSTSMVPSWKSMYTPNFLPWQTNKVLLSIPENQEQYKNIISKLSHLYDVLTNILHSLEDTQKRIIIKYSDPEYKKKPWRQPRDNIRLRLRFKLRGWWQRGRGRKERTGWWTEFYLTTDGLPTNKHLPTNTLQHLI